MDIRQIRQIASISRHGSFAKAADELGVSQPTLSRAVARLEDELGFCVFDRSGWRAQLTPMGAHILERATRVLGESERLDRDIKLIAAGELGEVRIGLGPAWRPVIMPRLAAALVGQFPKLRLAMMVEDREGLLAGLASGDFDIVLIAYGDDMDAGRLVIAEVMTDTAVAVVHPTHPLANGSRITMEAFATYPTVATAMSVAAKAEVFAMPDLGDEPQSRLRLNPALVTNDFATAMSLVRTGLCTYVGARHILRSELESGELVALDVEWAFAYRMVAAMSRAASHSPLLKLVVSKAQGIGAAIAQAGVGSIPDN